MSKESAKQGKTMTEAIMKFISKMSTINLFKYLKSRYSTHVISKCNLLLTTRRKILRLSLSNEFLRKCTLEKVAPRFIVSMTSKSKMKTGPNTERIFLNQEIVKNSKTQSGLKKSFYQVNDFVYHQLSTMDFLRLNKYLLQVNQRFRTERQASDSRRVKQLMSKRFGNRNVENMKYIHRNIS